MEFVFSVQGYELFLSGSALCPVEGSNENGSEVSDAIV
jgi:hypothetical protein